MPLRAYLPALLLLLVGCEAQLSAGSDSGLGGDDDTNAPGANLPLVPRGEPLHRFNRLEYNNTVRDLLGVDLRPADSFPPDTALGGFDNIAVGLRLSPTLFDHYYQAARDLTEAALGRTPVFTAERPAEDGAPDGIKVGGDARALHGGEFQLTQEIPSGDEYVVELSISGVRTGAAEAPTFEYLIDGAPIEGGETQGTPTSPHVISTTRQLSPGAHTFTVRPTNFINIGVENTNNEVLIHGLRIKSVSRTAAASAEKLILCDLVTPNCALDSLLTFARRAYRRPLSEDESADLAMLFAELTPNESEEEALKLGMRAVLLSAPFLYRGLRQEDATSEESLSGTYLASRLSYFLWSSMPDEELLQAAEEGELETEDGLRAQVERMLSSERASGLVDGFAEQWLGTRLFAGAAPSPELYPNFSEALRADMTAESLGFFKEFLDSELPLRDLPEPGFALLSDRLAAHYGLPASGSVALMKVSVSAGERQGLLELGAWLTAQSDPEGSSPIRRGRWLLEQVFCDPVPPPPAGVVTELPDIGDVPIREKLAVHRTEESCAGCHEMMDPLGLGFEAYDAVGAPREFDGDLPVDSSGELPGGLQFDGPRELSQLLLEDERISTCVAEKLAVYGLSRELHKSEEELPDKLLAAAGAEQATFKSLLLAIVLSPSFRKPPDAWDFPEKTP